MHPLLRTPNARFWVFVNDAWAKLTLRPNARAHWSKSWFNGEGHSFEALIWTHEGDRVREDWTNGGTDCDGHTEQSGACECDLLELRCDPIWHDSRDLFGGNPIARPEWHDAGRTRVYDQFAQAAGY